MTPAGAVRPSRDRGDVPDLLWQSAVNAVGDRPVVPRAPAVVLGTR